MSTPKKVYHFDRFFFFLLVYAIKLKSIQAFFYCKNCSITFVGFFFVEMPGNTKHISIEAMYVCQCILYRVNVYVLWFAVSAMMLNTIC